MGTFQRRFRISAFLVALAIASILLGVGLTTAQDEQVLVIGHAELTDSLDPARGFSTTGIIVLKATYDTLVMFPNDSTDEIIPNLATEW